MNPNALEMLRHFHAEYAHCIDDNRLNEWPTFFTVDCHYKITTARNVRQNLDAGIIWADSRDMLTDRITSLREANVFEEHTYRHVIQYPLIISQTSDTVVSTTSFLVIRITGDGPMDLFVTGKYLDIFIFVEGQLKLKERIVVCDSSEFDTLLAIPL